MAAACAAGCGPSSSFICVEDSQCGAQGRCESAGYCSFPDEGCPSGRRYEPNAGEGFASLCVPERDGSTGEMSTSGTTTASSSATTESAATDPTSASTSDSESSSTAITGPPTVVIDPNTRFQSLDGMGVQAWDYPIDDPDWNWDAVAPAFDEVDIHYVQLITLFRDWEPVNDDDDPFSTTPDMFDPGGEVAAQDIPMAQWLTDRGYALNVQKVLLPDWMVEADYEVLPAQYAEFAESVISYQQRLEDAGVTQTELELWQVGTGADAFNTPEAATAAADVLLDSLQNFGVDRRLLTPSVPGSVAEAWLSVWFESSARTQSTAAISVRGAATSELAAFEAVATWAEVVDVPVWAYDNWYCGADQGCPAAPAEDSSTWASAWEMAQQNYRLIVGAHASRIYHAAMVGAQPSVDPLTGSKFPTFYVLQHFANWIPPGSVNVLSTAEDPDVFTVAVERPDGSYAVILLNTGFEPTEVEVSLLKGGGLTAGLARQSVAGRYMNAVEPSASTRGLVFALPPNSLTSADFQVGD